MYIRQSSCIFIKLPGLDNSTRVIEENVLIFRRSRLHYIQVEGSGCLHVTPKYFSKALQQGMCIKINHECKCGRWLKKIVSLGEECAMLVLLLQVLCRFELLK